MPQLASEAWQQAAAILDDLSDPTGAKIHAKLSPGLLSRLSIGPGGYRPATGSHEKRADHDRLRPGDQQGRQIILSQPAQAAAPAPRKPDDPRRARQRPGTMADLEEPLTQCSAGRSLPRAVGWPCSAASS
jgi:hypothetical protein